MGTKHIILRKMLFGAIWGIIFMLITSACCIAFFTTTAFEFADVAMMDAELQDSTVTPQSQAQLQTQNQQEAGVKVAYAVATMMQADVFWGLIIFSLVVSTFGAAVGILPGTDDSSINVYLERGNEQASMLAISPNCPNCGALVEQNFCPQCGQEKSSAQGLTLASFAKQTIPDILNIDGKFFKTLRLLLTKPGFLTLEYLQARKASYTLPTQLYFVIAAVFFFVSTNLDFDVDTLIKQVPQLEEQIKINAAETNTPEEIIKHRLDSSLENYIPFYTFFMVLAFAVCLKILYPHWYYVEHLVFSLHYVAFFLLVWMVCIIIGTKIRVIENFGPYIIPLPYLYFALKNVHFTSSGWKFIPATLYFLFLFAIYISATMFIGVWLL